MNEKLGNYFAGDEEALTPIERKTLRAQVRDELLVRMGEGDVTPDEEINELQFTAEPGAPLPAERPRSP